MRRYDAIVLGAGPAGATAAFFLARAGLRVAIVERAAFPRRKVCGEFVSATTFPVLDAMGVGMKLRRQGGPPTRRVGFDAGHRSATAPMPLPRGGQEWGRTVARAILDPTLLEAARGQGVEVWQPWKAVDIRGSHEVTILAEGREARLQAPIVVAAHGSWEPGTLPTQTQTAHKPGDVLAFKGFFHGATFDDDLMSLCGFPGGYGGAVHRDADTVGLSFCVRRDVLATLRRRYQGMSAWDALFRHVAGHCRAVREAFGEARLEAPAKASGPLRPGVRTLASGGIYRVGNAAGEAHPTIAEGISMAIQSGALLAHCIAADDEPERRYTEAWRAQFAGRVRIAELYARMCMNPALSAAAVRTMAALPTILTAGAALSGKTHRLPAAALQTAEDLSLDLALRR